MVTATPSARQTTRMSTTHKRPGQSLGTLRVVLWVFCLLFVVMPLGAIALYGILSWRGTEVLNADVLDAAINSAVSSLAAAVIATIVALALAVFVEHTDLPGRGALRLILLTPLLVPPFIGAIAWTGVFGPASPINMQWTQWFGHVLWNVYGADGVIFLLALHGYPVAYLMIAVALDRVPAELEEAARISGAEPVHVLGSITLPLVAPAALSAFILQVVSNLADFGIPSIVGTPERYTTLATLIYRYVQSGSVDNPLQVVAGIGIMMLAVTMLALSAVKRIPQRTITFAPRAANAMPLRLRGRLPIAVILWTVGLAITVLPTFALASQSLLAAPGIPLTWSNLTLDSYREAFASPTTMLGLTTSIVLSVGAGVICGIVGMAIGSLAARSHRRDDHALGSLALLPQSIPGLIIAVGWLLLAPHIGLFNTPWLILAAYVTAFVGLVVQTVEAPLKAIPDALVDAARISGASPLTAMRDVIWRMGASAAVTGAMLVVLTAVRELTISSLLLAPDAQTLGVVVFSLQQAGSYNAAAALSLLITVVGLAALRTVTRVMRGR